MRKICVIAAAAATLGALGCMSTVDLYSGADRRTQPGEHALRAAYKAAKEMVTTARGNYAEPHYRAFDRLKFEQERWLGKPVPGGVSGMDLESWLATYRKFAKRIHLRCPSSVERRKMIELEVRKFSDGVEPLLPQTHIHIDKLKRRSARGK